MVWHFLCEVYIYICGSEKCYPCEPVLCQEKIKAAQTLISTFRNFLAVALSAQGWLDLRFSQHAGAAIFFRKVAKKKSYM